MYIYSITAIILLLITFIIAKNKPKYRNIIIALNMVICAVYFIWRIWAIPVNDGWISLVLGIILYLAELFGITSFFIFQYMFFKKYHLKQQTIADYHDQILPFVDVLICTYNEPLDILQMTMASAAELDYPKDRFSVHVLDDGRRDELKELCRQYEIDYITRPDNKGAKAGNINNALKIIDGDLFAVLDADMLPKPDFLKRTVGYFVDRQVAFVQTPQVYYNQDMYQYNLRKSLPNEQDFFMREIQEARAAHNAVLHVGTNAVFRKEYVMKIGGYPDWSITEDMAVGMMLQAEGYRSVFINEELVYGLSATTFSELVKQRDRWCRGNLQVQKRHNPLFVKGLNFAQKIAYIDGTMYWFANIQKMIYISCPLIFLLFHTMILNASLNELIAIYFPYFLEQILIFRVLLENTRSLLWAHFYEMVMAPHLVVSLVKELFNIKVGFNVTAKENIVTKRYFQLKMVLPHIVMILLTFLAWVVSYNSLIQGQIVFGSFLINLFWSIYNLAGLAVALLVAWQKPIFRKMERMRTKETLMTKMIKDNRVYNAFVTDISGIGIGISFDKDNDLKIGDPVIIDFGNFNIPCKIIRCQGQRAAANYDHASPDQFRKLMKVFMANIVPYYDVHVTQVYE